MCRWSTLHFKSRSNQWLHPDPDHSLLYDVLSVTPPKHWPWSPYQWPHPNPDLGLLISDPTQPWPWSPYQWPYPTLTLVSLSVTLPPPPYHTHKIKINKKTTLVSCMVWNQEHPPRPWLWSPLWCVISDTHPNPDLDLLISDTHPNPDLGLLYGVLSVTPTQTLTFISVVVCDQWHPPKPWPWSPYQWTHPNPDLGLLISEPTQTLTLVSLPVTPTQTLTLTSLSVNHPNPDLGLLTSDTHPNPDLGLLYGLQSVTPTQTLTLVSLPVTPTQTLTLVSCMVCNQRHPPKPWPWSPYQWHPNPDFGLLYGVPVTPTQTLTLVSCMVCNQWHPPKPWPWSPVWCGRERRSRASGAPPWKRCRRWPPSASARPTARSTLARAGLWPPPAGAPPARRECRSAASRGSRAGDPQRPRSAPSWRAAFGRTRWDLRRASGVPAAPVTRSAWWRGQN